jgi:opacity protein-like surface antigen
MVALGSAIAYGQTGEPGENIGEFSAYGGLAFGQLGGHPAVGGSTGVFFSKYAGVLIDSSFVPIGGRTLVRYPQATASSFLFDNNLTGHIQIPVKPRWAPYAILSTSILYNTYQIQSLRPDGTFRFHGQSDVKFGFQTGFGVRYFVKDNWGVRGEYRYTISTQNLNRIFFGVFYRVPTDWPLLPRARNKCRRGCAY